MTDELKPKRIWRKFGGKGTVAAFPALQGKGDPDLRRDNPPRMPLEPEEAYQAFLMYLRHSKVRTMAEIARSLGRNKSTLSRWHDAWQWIPRIERWYYLGQEEGKDPRIKDLIEREYQQHLELVKVGEEAIARWRASDDVPSIADIAKVIDLASRLGRLSLGMASDRVEVSQDLRAAVHVDIHAALLKAYGEEEPDDVVDVEAMPASPVD